LIKKFLRNDRALAYVRMMHESHPDIPLAVFKCWIIRHKIWEWMADSQPASFPEITRLEQLELTHDKRNTPIDSPPAGSGGPIVEHPPAGSGEDGGHRGEAEG